jgi:hypothetical protein
LLSSQCHPMDYLGKDTMTSTGSGTTLNRKGGITSKARRCNIWHVLLFAITSAGIVAIFSYLFVRLPHQSSLRVSDFPRYISKIIRSPFTATFPTNHRRLLQEYSLDRPRPLRVLYTITTLAEYDNGDRATTKGDDRMSKVLIPVMKQTVESLVEQGYEVDVFIVAHFTMTREHLIRQALPGTVGLTVWDDASPLSYDPGNREDPKGKLRVNTLGLARQHRYVVKQHLMEYDFFMCFEDDMILKGGHVKNHLEMTQQLFRLRESAPDTIDPSTNKRPVGTLSKSQLRRVFPGIMRVEVLLDEENYGTQEELEPVPVQPHAPLESETCCHLINATVSPNRPASPASDKVFLWETGIRALGVRYIPEVGYVAFQRGPSARDGEHNLTIADYWAGSDGYFGKDRRPQPGDFKYINNQGGWMATRQQVWEWHTQICLGGFLPPYESPHFNFDGLDPRNVEWWSGAMGLSTSRHGCNMQRILSLDVDKFPKHLIYHSANNKQRQLHGKMNRFVKIDNLYGQLLTTQLNYEKQFHPAVGEAW